MPHLKTYLLRIALGLMTISSFATNAADNTIVAKTLPETIKSTWLQLDDLFAAATTCNAEITLLPEQGLRGLYCHLKVSLSYSALQQQLSFPIFLRGPHSLTKLNLKSVNHFGYYNPNFVLWLANAAIVGKNNPVLQARIQPFYQRHLQMQVRTYYLAYQYKQKNSALFNKITEQYLANLKQPNPPSGYLRESFRTFADDRANQGYSWYEANVAA